MLEGMKPIPQGSMRHIGNGRMIHNKAQELAVYRASLALLAKTKFKTPSAEPVSITLEFGIVQPKSVRRPMPTVPPDIDKLARAVLDALTGIAYIDDSQVVRLAASKVYSQNYYVQVGVEFGAFELM